jgi:hypothetical protein
MGPIMRLSIKALTLASAATFALIMLLMGLLALAKPDWGAEFMGIVGILHPGAHGVNIVAVLISTIYAAVHGAFTGALIAWLYNRFLGTL